MTTPPPGDDEKGDGEKGDGVPPPPPDQPLPPAYLPQPPWYPPPQGYPPPPGYRPPGQYDYPPPAPPPWQPHTPRISVGMVFLGAFLYMPLNFVIGFAVLAMSDGRGHSTVVLGAVVLALIAFGGGGVLLATAKANGKGLGLGLMIGWAALSVVSVGFCTGLNPELYT
ncbi:hypothetical protein [Mycobacterium sp. ENV421]|uniref:hypothetical protein n=1 Tax=unclassified Mycobacterium TaxID=2642494 RepID=UPI001E2B84A6|nr:hypothetical protein [Mycobacterium sp. ENV421]